MAVRLIFKNQIRFCLLFCLTLLFFVSCQDSEPSLLAVEHTLTFDYASSSSSPKMRLGVCCSPSSEVQRLEVLRLIHQETGLEWNCSEVEVFKGEKNRNWAGYTNFIPAYNESFPQGFYSIYYEDSAGRSCEGEFKIEYPEEFSAKSCQELPLQITNNADEYIVLYNNDDILIYYGKFKDEWGNGRGILEEYPDAAKTRRCYINGDLVFMMPEEPVAK